MSEAFSDDLSDPTPSPPPPVAIRSSTSNKSSAVSGNNGINNNTRRGSTATSKATTHQRTTSAASASASATTRASGPHGHKAVAVALAMKSTTNTSSASASHSRTASLANSLVMSQSGGKGTMVNGGGARSDEDEDDDEEEEDEEEDGSQSGSDLSSPPSEGEGQPKRGITEEHLGVHDEANEEENEDGEEDEGEDEEKGNDEDEDDNEEDETSFAARIPPRHGRTASGGAGPGIPPRATRQSSLRSGSAAGRSGRGVIPAGMWEWAKKKNYKKAQADKSDGDDEDGSEGEDGEEDEEDEEGAGAHEGRPADSRDESLVQPTANAADEDEPMLNGTTNQHSPNGTFNSDDDVTTQHLPIPTVKIEPPPSATMSSFRPQDIGPSPSVSPAPTPAPTAPSERRTNGRSKASGRTSSKRSHRPPPAKRPTAAQQQQQQQLQLQQQLRDAEDDAEAEEVERANRDMEAAEDAEEGEDDEGELEGEGEYGNRQDALDALSLLELKFALVRQRIYQDKMEELGREERLMKDGSHPELLHTYIELDKRKERRATLADLKRKREVDLAAVTRTNDEDAVWSWWMIQKDVVQSTLITEASRKRRRVERERRALLDPLRRNLNRTSPPPELPGSRDRDGDEDMLPPRPSTKAILAVALRHPYARLRTYDSAQLAKNKLGENAIGPAGIAGGNGGRKPQESMPTLSQLDQGHINEDLEVLLGYRRGSGALGAVITAGAGAGPGMPDGAAPGGVGGPGGMYGPPGMDHGISGTITVNNAAVVPAPEAFNPTGMGGMGGDPAQAGGMLDYPRSIYELEQRERGRNREGQAFNDHLAAHQYSSTGMPPNGGSKGPTNGRERERERPGSKKYANSNAPSMGHGGYVGGPPPTSQQQQQQREREMHAHSGYAPHTHRQAMDPYASPGLGLQNMQRLPDTGNPRDRDNGMGGIQHMPLPPAPSTIPAGSSSGASKHHHHHHPAPPAPAHPQANQHPSLMWEGGRRERERERDGDLARERSHSGASRNPGSGYATNTGPPSGNGGVSSSSGRPHSHSVSHQHQHAHYHPTHTHSRSSAQGSTPHTHSHSVLHTHPHSHTHATGSTSHLHVIHNHGPGPTGNGGSAGGNGAGGSSSSSSRRNNAYDEGAPGSGGHRARTSYPSGPTVDRERELRERERLAGAAPSLNVMHPSLSHGGGQERDRHTGYAIPHSSRDSWNDRDRDRTRPKEREDRRDQDRERAGHPQSGFSGHQPLPLPPQQQQQQGGGVNSRGSRSGSLSTGMHASQGNGYSQSQAPLPGSRYPYANPSAYSPPATQASQSRRNSPPPPSLPPVPNTSRYSSGSNAHRRASPNPADPLSYPSSSQAQAEIAAIHSPTSSLNPPGFNPWSAPPRSSGRPYRPSPPPQKITPPTGTPFNSSAGGGPLNPLPGPTLSPILPSAVSPAPRPSISPAPRPPSSSSLHAILQPPPRESVLSPQLAKRNGSGSGEGGSGVGPMELDPPVQQQQTGFRHPSLAPLNHDGK